MARPPKWRSAENAALGLLPLRQHWQDCNRHDRKLAAWNRANRKARDKKRRKCRCKAYPWPHRPAGGLCRWPDPPLECWHKRSGGNNRPYRLRYAGILRQIARNNGMHPIRDREILLDLLPQVVRMAKVLKSDQRKWKYKYRNMQIIQNADGSYGVRAVWTTAGPTM